MTGRSGMTALLLLVGAAALDAGTAASHPAASYGIDGSPGAVIAVTIGLEADGRIVADRFLDDPDLVSDERVRFADLSSASGPCTAASLVRPFTRLRRFDASGAMAWEWRIDQEEQALRLLDTGPGDCLSPDGSFLAVAIYQNDPNNPEGEKILLGNGIVAVGAKPGFADAIGRRTGRAFGHPRFTGPLGWRTGEPATFEFEVFPDDGREEPSSASDEAVMSADRGDQVGR